MKCSPGYILRGFECVLTASGCLAGTTLDTEDGICKGTKYSTTFPCSIGSFNSLSGQTSVASCTACSAGKYCPYSALDATTGDCDPGYYCTGGSILAKNDDLITGSTATGGRCTTGHYCPAGSIIENLCSPGSYCDQSLLAAVSNACIPGYYCIGGTTVSRPLTLATEFGAFCPQGKYC